MKSLTNFVVGFGASDKIKSLDKEIRLAAKAAHLSMHYHEKPGVAEPAKHDPETFPLQEFSVERLELLLWDPIIRIVETMSYRPSVNIPGSGFASWDRAFRDTIVGPANSYFAFGGIPDRLSGQDHRREWSDKHLATAKVFTHGLCIWMTEHMARMARQEGKKSRKKLLDMDSDDEMPFLKGIRR